MSNDQWVQREVVLTVPRRGFHLITGALVEQLPEISEFSVGIAHFFILHTSASLTINENADPDVQTDLETSFNVLAPDGAAYHVHTLEGPDDMPAHVKASMLGCDVSVPISGGRLTLGTWQGIYLCEHRNRPSPRRILITLQGQT